MYAPARLPFALIGVLLQSEGFWPNGILADKPPERDESIRNVTQVLCKAKLLGIVSGRSRPASPLLLLHHRTRF